MSAIFAGQFADVDAGSSFGGIAVVGNTANAGTQGSWQYSSNGGGNWFAIGTVADGATALAVSSSTLIRFVPVANYNGTPPALTVRGLDNTYVARLLDHGRQRDARHRQHHDQRRHHGDRRGHRQPVDFRHRRGRHAVGDQRHDQRRYAVDRRSGDLEECGRRRRGDPFQDHGDHQRHALQERRHDADHQRHVHHLRRRHRRAKIHAHRQLQWQRQLYDSGLDVERGCGPGRRHGQRHDHGQSGGRHPVRDQRHDERRHPDDQRAWSSRGTWRTAPR